MFLMPGQKWLPHEVDSLGLRAGTLPPISPVILTYMITGVTGCGERIGDP